MVKLKTDVVPYLPPFKDLTLVLANIVVLGW